MTRVGVYICPRIGSGEVEKKSGGFFFELINAPVNVALVGSDFHHVLIQQVKLSIGLTNFAPYLRKLRLS